MQIDVTTRNDYFLAVIGFAVKQGLFDQFLRQLIFLITFVDGRKQEQEITRARFEEAPPTSLTFKVERSSDKGASWSPWFQGRMQYREANAPAMPPEQQVNVINPAQGEGWCLMSDDYSLI